VSDADRASADSALRISIDNLLEGVQIIGSDWTYLYLNATAAQHANRPAGELVGRTMMACYPGIERTAMFATLARVMSGREAERAVNEFTYPDGTKRWFELLVQPVPDGICVLSLDITERHVAELRLLQAQKMEAIGQLAGGVAHDFNNILTAILGYAQLITEQIGPDKPIGRDMAQIVTAAERASALTRQLLAFSRKSAMRPSAVSLNAIVEGVEPMLRRLIGENIGVRLTLDRAAPTVVADAVHLEQVLLNLAVNARDAMPNGGALSIATDAVTLDATYVAGHPESVTGEFALLTVSDTGVGMTPDVRARMFEPFFTTKPRGRGTGLGLAAVQGIVKQLRGSVWVYSEPGRGTVFKIYLPRTDEAAAEPATARRRTALEVGTETVLLVEDEPAVRAFARLVLERHGYRVREAASGEAALAALNDPAAAIDLVVTDVVLPGMDGVQLARAVRREHDDLKVLFMSGYAEPLGGTLPADAELLEKPFTAAALLTRVRSLLG
jgi:two-component system, cell cycle sensor histidine kinase and response regulator CckA